MQPCAAVVYIMYNRMQCLGAEGLHSHVDEKTSIFFQHGNWEICSSWEVIPCRTGTRNASEYTTELMCEIESYCFFPWRKWHLCVGANIPSPWCGIRRVNELEMVLRNTVQKKLSGRRVGNIFEGEMSFSCATSLHYLHLWGHSRPADFQEVTTQNSIVNVEYVGFLKLTVVRKETFSVTRK